MRDGEGGRCKYCGDNYLRCKFRAWLDRQPLIWRLARWLY